MIYVASSLRNPHQQNVVALLRHEGCDVYDFRNPEDDNRFAWSDVDVDWRKWSPGRLRTFLRHPTVKEAFAKEMNVLARCASCVLVLPCEKSAHLALGFAAGAQKRTAIYMPEADEPELMYAVVHKVLVTPQELSDWGRLEYHFQCAEKDEAPPTKREGTRI